MGPGNVVVTFDAVSLFTMVFVQDVLGFFDDLFPADIISLFRHVLTTTYFQWNGGFYEQADGVKACSPFSPVVANIYEKFEELAIRVCEKMLNHM